ncbi:cyclic-phosphate processing receiver domain-containing protein [Peribacillus saganii]|uniref:cyclic-phosphate processing receiver domain-containing protein n=1 Tax=Peribacillus saganii TaxID=2303992 RepID=UPI002D76F229|nr:cyclic-phosphate processing receiver domain-containing protein [Peribacillus saganii]
MLLYNIKKGYIGLVLLTSEKINLYVDDLRDCPNGFIIARNTEQAIHYIETYRINILSLDHDLGEDKDGNILPTGYDLVKYFCEQGE